MLLKLTSIPQLSHVDSEIFTLRYYAECMACTFCHDGCCQYGCDVNLGERDRILAVQAELAPHVSVPPERWFSTEVEADEEYPTGKFVRTHAEDGRCVFLNRKTRGCSLHAFALATGRDYHQLKPMVCWVFPVSWDQRVLQPASDVKDDLVCAGNGLTLYQAVRDELRVVFGDELVRQLDLLSEQTLATEDFRRVGQAG